MGHEIGLGDQRSTREEGWNQPRVCVIGEVRQVDQGSAVGEVEGDQVMKRKARLHQLREAEGA